VQTAAGRHAERTLEAMKQVEGFFLKQPEVENMVSVPASASRPGPERAQAFVR
jgi:multidrug efflux pump